VRREHPRQGAKTTESQEQPLSRDAALVEVKRAFIAGRLRIIPHFRRRMEDRRFSMPDVERVILSGGIYDHPEYCMSNCNWKYRVRAPLDGIVLEVVVAIDHEQAYEPLPLVIPITGYWVGEADHGKRIDGKEKGH